MEVAPSRTGFAWAWLLLTVLLLAIGAYLAWDIYTDYRRVEQTDLARIQSRVTIIEQNLERQLQAADRALGALRDDLPVFRAQPDGLTFVNRRLLAIREAIPGIRSMLLVNAQGECIASDRKELIGINFRDGERYRAMSADPDPGKLHISAPFLSPLKNFVIAAGKVVLDDKGGFAGYLLAIVDPEFFGTLLNSVVSTPDMRALVIHGDGSVVYRIPDPQNLIGVNVAQKNSVTLDHIESGRHETLFYGKSVVTGESRMIVTRTLQPNGVTLSRPLLIAVSREIPAMFAVWRYETGLRAGLFGLLVLVSVFGLLIQQSRQRNFDLLAAADESKRRQAEETLRQSEEHLAITLRSIGDAVIVTDVQGRVTQMNPSAEQLTGWPFADAHGVSLSQVFRVINAHTREPVESPADKVLAHGEIVGLANHTALIARDGREYQIADSAAPIRNAAGDIAGVVLVFSDVTEQYAITQKLREREALLNTVTGHAQVGMLLIDHNYRFVFANPALAHVLGTTVEALLGKAAGAAQIAAFEGPLQVRLDRAFAGEGSQFDLTVAPRQGGEPDRHVHVIVDPAVQTDSGPVIIVLVTDMSERIRAEALRAQLAAAVESSSDAMIVRDLSNRIVYWSKGAEQLYGLPASEVLGKVESYDIPTEDLARREDFWDRLHRGEAVSNFYALRMRKDGTPIHVSISVSPVRDDSGSVIGIVSIVRDVSELMQARAALETSRAKLQAALQSMGEAVFITDTLGRLVEFNDAFVRWHGYANHEQCPRLLAEYAEILWVAPIGGEELALEDWPASRALRGESATNAELVVRRRDTGREWIGSFNFSPIADERGGLAGAVVTGRDVTELKRSEQARALLVEIIESSNDAIVSRDLKGLIRSWNAGAEKMFGIPAMDAIGRHIEDVLPTDIPSNVEANNEAVLRGNAFIRETNRKTHEGRTITVRGSYSPLRDITGKVMGVSLIMQDITALKQAEAERIALEAQLREAQKMEAIGTLAGGIAHDFNNIIASIMGNAALAVDDAEGNAKVLSGLHEIQKASARARDLVQQILSFSRRQPAQLKRMALEPVVMEATRLLRATLPKRISLNVRSGRAPEIVGDATQIQQVIINLATNAAQAMAKGPGRLDIELDTVTLSSAMVQAHPALIVLEKWTPSQVACISMRDTGSGMDPATLSRIFEPFFTTKEVDQGTGLGLAVVHGIVQAHGGAITVESEPGRGSLFCVYLPAAGSEAPVADAPAPPAAASLKTPGAGVRVLYIDDDELLVNLTARTLERRGFVVSAHNNQHEALEVLRARPDAFDVVLSDYNMPGMSGLEVAREVRHIRADLPVIVTSGFIDDVLLAQAKAAGVSELASKVDSPEQLCATLLSVAQRS